MTAIEFVIEARKLGDWLDKNPERKDYEMIIYDRNGMKTSIKSFTFDDALGEINHNK